MSLWICCLRWTPEQLWSRFWNAISGFLSSHPPEQSLDEIHHSNVALRLALSTPASKRRAIPPELILQILEDPSRWAILHKIDEHVPNTYDTTAKRHVVTLTTPPLTFGVCHIRRIDLSHEFKITDVCRGFGRFERYHKPKWRFFALGVRKPGLQEVSNWHHITADLGSPYRTASHCCGYWDYRASIHLDHPIFNEIVDGDTLVARTGLGHSEYLHAIHYVKHDIKMEIIGVDVCAELRPILCAP